MSTAFFMTAAGVTEQMTLLAPLTREALSTRPANTKHLHNIYTMLDQRRKRWADVV